MVDSPKRMNSSREARRLALDKARVGQILDERFELLELLGHGGMGAVYKARHLLMDRLVAVKMLLQDIADDPEINDRFKREAKAAGRVNHPNVVQLIDYGQGAEGAYIVVEYIAGLGLDALLKQEGALPPAKAVHIFEQICEGVGKAHAKGIVHRDLKPSNVMLTNEDGDPYFVKIVDFGLAKAMDPGEESQKLTQSGDIFGSPVYMSPQQCLGHAADPRSDIYAMGVLMYETLTGKVPFLGSNVGETIAKQLQEEPKPFAEMRPDLEIPASLEQVVRRALEKDPENRQSSMLELKDEIIDSMLPKLQAKRKQTTVLVKPTAPAAPASGATGAGDDVKTRVINSANLNFDTRLRATQSASAPEAPPPVVKNPVNVLLVAVLVMLVACAGLLAANMLSGQKPVCVSAPKANANANAKPENKVPSPATLPAQSSNSSQAQSISAGSHKPREREPLMKKVVSEIRQQELLEGAARLEKIQANNSLHEKAKHIKKLIEAERAEHKSAVSRSGSSNTSQPTESNVYLPRRNKHSASWEDFSDRYERKGEHVTDWQPPVPGSR